MNVLSLSWADASLQFLWCSNARESGVRSEHKKSNCGTRKSHIGYFWAGEGKVFWGGAYLRMWVLKLLGWSIII